jgi:hypothetical protein
MPSYYRVYVRFWSDPDIEHCSDDAKLLALYLMTGPHRRLEGLFRLPKAYICGDLGWTSERLAEPFRELLAERSGKPGFIAYDEQAQVVLLRNALKYQAPENTNQVTACLRQLEDLPDTPLTSEFRRLAERYCKRLAERLPEGFGQPIPHPPSPSPSPALKDLASFTGVGDMPADNDQTSRQKGREGKAPRQSRPPRTPRHPSDEFVIQRARQIQAESGPDAAKAYLRTVAGNYEGMSKAEQLRRLEAIIVQDAAAETGDPS